jgi:lipoprotein-releasing system permease protein
VAALIVALALANGFRDEMRDKILRGTAHITAARRDEERITDRDSAMFRVRKIAGVTDVFATTYDGVLLNCNAGSAYGVVRGLEPSATNSIRDLRETLIAGSVEGVFESVPKRASANSRNATAENATPVIVGSELAARLELKVGDHCKIVSAAPKRMSGDYATDLVSVVVKGIVKTGLYEYDSTWIYMSLSQSSRLSVWGELSASTLGVMVADIYNSNEVAGQIRSLLGKDFVTVDWQEANRPLFAALTIERRIGVAIISLIIFLGALNITSTLVLVVVERRTDIAILSAMGARSRSIMSVFMIEGAFVGIIGAITGVMVGIAACVVGNRYHLISLPSEVYSISSVPLHPGARDMALAALIAFALSLIATIYPARAAARVRPAEALRD